MELLIRNLYFLLDLQKHSLSQAAYNFANTSPICAMARRIFSTELE